MNFKEQKTTDARPWDRVTGLIGLDPDRPPRLLIVQPEAIAIHMMIEALGRPCLDSAELPLRDDTNPLEFRCDCETRHEEACCVVVASLKQLHRHDLSTIDAVICAVNLPDGTGLDALAYLRGTRGELPVILTGAPSEAVLAMEAIRFGAMDFLVTAAHDMRALPLSVEKCLAHHRIKHENERLQRDLSRSLAELEIKNQQLEAAIRQLETMARTDELTSLANRRWLNLMLDGTWTEATRRDFPLAFLMIDLDGLKDLNDRLGHQRGDEMLKLAAKVIESNSRDVDVAARYGGDEFCLLMPHTETDEAVAVATRIVRAFEHAVSQMQDERLLISLSVGMAQINLSRPVNGDQLMSHADEALYAAKAAGKNRVMVRGSRGILEPSAVVG